MVKYHLFKKEALIRAKERSEYVFREISNGLYVVDKDRYGKLGKFADTNTISKSLNSYDSVAVVRLHDGNIITNFDINYVPANKQLVSSDKDEWAILHKGEIVLNKVQADELMKSAEKINEKLKDKTINVTINVEKLIGDDVDVNKLASKIEELTRKVIKDNKNL